MSFGHESREISQETRFLAPPCDRPLRFSPTRYRQLRTLRNPVYTSFWRRVTRNIPRNPVSRPPSAIAHKPLSPWAHPAYRQHLKTKCKNMLQCFYCCVKFSYIRLKLNEVSDRAKQRRKSRLHWVRWNLERSFGNARFCDRLSYRTPHRSRHSLSNRFDVISLTP